MEFLYQIKINNYDREVVTQDIVDMKDKAEVIKYLETQYPEYFEGNRVAQKLSKKSEQIVYVTIYELDDYWRKYWKQEIECVTCHKKVPWIQVKNILGYVHTNKFTCCQECEDIRKQELEELDSDEESTYWNNQCKFYFIYKITNKKNNKCYVGYTAREPIFRWWEHFKHSTLPIGKALTEFGIESFTFEVLEKHSKDTKTIEEMHELETQYMTIYNSINDGYNCIPSKQSSVSTKPLFDLPNE